MEGVSGGGMQFYTSAGGTLGTPGWTSAMYVSSSGNVGIGTTSPTRPLTVKSSNIGIRMDNSSNSNAGLEYYVSTGTFYNWLLGAQYNVANTFEITPSTTIGGTTYSTPAFVVNANGNVGIGTTSPVSPLQVNGTAQFGDVGSMTFSGASVNIRTTATGSIALTHTAVRTYTLGIDSSGTFKIRDFDAPADRLSITSGGNVGIGTTTPSTKLFVSGSHVSGQGMSTFKGSDYAIVNLVAPATGDGSNGYWGFRAQDPNFTDLMWFGHVTSSTQSGFVVAPNFETVNSASLYVARSNGNVGIGTSSPGAKLHVVGNTQVSDQFAQGVAISSKITNYGAEFRSSGASAQIFFGRSGDSIGSGAIGADASYALSVWNTSDFSRFLVISQSGNVGIGTTSPDDKLEIEGGGIGINNTSDPYLRFRESGTIVSDIFTDTSANNLVVRGSSGHGVEILANGASEGAAHLVVSGSGNVGIGIASPVTNLHINGVCGPGSSGALSLAAPAAGGGCPSYIIMGNNDSAGTAGPNIISAANRTLAFGVGDSFSSNSGGNFTGSMYIINGGNVGIGTSSPATKLHLDIPSAPSNIAEIFRATDGALADFKILLNRNTTLANSISVVNTAAGNMSFETSNTERMRITSGGSLLINTTSQAGYGGVVPKLEVVQTSVSNTDGDGGTLSLYGNSSFAQDTGAALVLGQAYSGTTTATGARVRSGKENNTSGNFASYLALDTRPNGGAMTERMRITSAGNVGISTTSPSTILHLSSTTPELSFTATGLNRTSTVGMGDGANFYIKNTTAGNLYISDYNSVYIAYGASSQNVGIGTTSPVSKLHVSGAITIEAQSTQTQFTTTFAGTLTTNTNIAFVPTGSFKAAFFDYYVASGSVNMRAGTVMAVHNNSTSRYTDTSTADIGTTAPVDFSTSIVAGSLVLTANIASGTWEIKTAYRAL